MYQKGKLLGKGGDGYVYEVLKDGKKYALKDIAKSGDELEINSLRKANYLQKELDHPNIVKVFETYEDDKSIVIIMELCSVDLDKIINRKKLNMEEIKSYLRQLISAVKYLEERNILHDDIKAQNILICDDILKLTDFGSAEILEKGQVSNERYSTFSLTLAPEMNSPGYDYSINAWQIGILLYKMLFNKLPYMEELSEILDDPSYYYGNLKCFEFMKNNKIKIPDTDPNTFDILSRMLEIDPEKRITLDEMLNHPFLS
jgi:serine/threonine protein kinase